MEEKKKDNNKTIKIILLFIIIFSIGFITFLAIKYKDNEKKLTNTAYKINVDDLTYLSGSKTSRIKIYKQENFDSFLSDYKAGNLPQIYVTEFLFDGVSMYKPYDLDDFVESGNGLEVEPLKITNININTTKPVSFTGKLTGGMISVNTNDLTGDVSLLLNNLTLDTDSKKVPAIYIYNKDITYTDYKVTINALSGTNNYIEGGKLKKVSLTPSDDLDIYLDKYKTYTNYYGIYTSDEIEDILFAKVEADKEDLNDGDPTYYYKASGAISSDIDITFEGKGYLEVTSKNKEGIESKGNLVFSGGTGDYVINSYDDCLNTTTDKSENANARNDLTINVKSLTAIVNLEADEGDAIDSNGKLVIDGGKILAIAKPGQDSGLDSEDGTYINGGTVLTTGDMSDRISNESKQRFITLSFKSKIDANVLLVLTDIENNNVFAYTTDRSYSYLIYSSPSLEDKGYYLYRDGVINGKEKNGLYTSITSYKNGVALGYTDKGTNEGNMTPPNDGGTPPEKPEGDMIPPNDGGTPPEKPNGDMNPQNNEYNQEALTKNKTFTLSGISNIFNGVGLYGEL